MKEREVVKVLCWEAILRVWFERCLEIRKMKLKIRVACVSEEFSISLGDCCDLYISPEPNEQQVLYIVPPKAKTVLANERARNSRTLILIGCGAGQSQLCLFAVMLVTSDFATAWDAARHFSLRRLRGGVLHEEYVNKTSIAGT